MVWIPEITELTALFPEDAGKPKRSKNSTQSNEMLPNWNASSLSRTSILITSCLLSPQELFSKYRALPLSVELSCASFPETLVTIPSFHFSESPTHLLFHVMYPVLVRHNGSLAKFQFTGQGMEHHLLKYLGSYNLFFIIGFKKKKIHLSLAVPGLHCSAWASHCNGLSCRRARASVVAS